MYMISDHLMTEGKPNMAPPLMEFVLLCLHIVLQEDLDLRSHLWAYVFQEEASDDTKAAESD